MGNCSSIQTKIEQTQFSAQLKADNYVQPVLMFFYVTFISALIKTFYDTGVCVILSRCVTYIGMYDLE